MNTARLILITGLCLGSSGCIFSGKKTAAVVPAPPPVPKPAANQPPFQRPLPPLPVATEIAEPPPPPQLPAVQNPAAAKLPVPAPPPPRQNSRRKPSPMPPPVAPPPTTAAVAPTPELREIISGEQRRQYEAEFSQDVDRAGAVLKQAAVRSLNTEQQETTARIRTFLAQAAAARDNDISTALQLARRAELLGQELLKSMR